MTTAAIKRILTAGLILAVAGAVVWSIMRSQYWAARSIGDQPIMGLSLGELKERLGTPSTVYIPQASSNIRFRLEGIPQAPDLAGLITDPALRGALRSISRNRELGPIVLTDALGQAEVTFGRAIVRAGFRVGFEDPASMVDQLTADWIEVNAPFRGSLFGVHLGDPWANVQTELRLRGAQIVTEASGIPSLPLLRNVSVSGAQGNEKLTGTAVGGVLVLINQHHMYESGALWAVLVERDEHASAQPVTRLTAWDASLRTAVVSRK